MTIEQTVRFGAADIKSVSVQCERCQTVIHFTTTEAADGTIYCPGCNREGNGDCILWTKEDSGTVKSLVLTLLRAMADDSSRVVKVTLAA